MIHETLSPASHGLLDYVSVVVFALAPTLFQFGGVPAFVAYGLAVVHLLLTLATRFPMGMFDGVTLRAHGVVELVVSVVLIVLPWVAGFVQPGAQWFFPVMGILIFALWLLSDYGMPGIVEAEAGKVEPGSKRRAIPGRRHPAGADRAPGPRRQPAEDEAAAGKGPTGKGRAGRAPDGKGEESPDSSSDTGPAAPGPSSSHS